MSWFIEIWNLPDNFKKSSDFDTYFSLAVYFHFYKIEFSGVFYQKIFQHILNGNFVLNKGI